MVKKVKKPVYKQKLLFEEEVKQTATASKKEEKK